ncbi:MAG: glycosyltransferase family 2 protein [Acidobacteriota bacterium]|nr:glycosyltransferase family 2 protein [Acidobacteriota bacterium]
MNEVIDVTNRTTEATVPLVSVIIPTYNYAHLIGHSLGSLKAQTYQNWECIVIDDGSTDDTAEVVGRYVEADIRIKYVFQENRRQAAARNNGIRNSKGDYLQFLDADDLIEPQKFERQVEYLQEHSEVDIVYGDVRFFNAGHIEERYDLYGGQDKPGISGQGIDILISLIRKDTIPINTPLVRKSVIERVGLFDEKLSPIEDWDYWVRCAAEGIRFQYEDFEGTHALVRYHAESASTNGLLRLGATSLMRKKVMDMPVGQVVLQLNKELGAEEEGLLGIENVLSGKLFKGIYQLSKAGLHDKPFKHKLKWLFCALIAPIASKRAFHKVYSSSLSRFVTSGLSSR